MKKTIIFGILTIMLLNIVSATDIPFGVNQVRNSLDSRRVSEPEHGVWFYLLRNNGGIFGLIDINNLQAAVTWVPDWLVNLHRSTFMLWFHIVLLTLVGLGVIWEGIKYWKTGR